MINTATVEQARKQGLSSWKDLGPDSTLGPAIGKRVLILGTDALAKELCQSMLAKRRSGYRVIGFLDRDPTQVGKRLVNPSVIGTFDQLYEIVEHCRIDTVAVCLEDRRGGLPVTTLLDLKATGVQVVDGHELYERETGRLSIEVLKPSSLIFSDGFRRHRAVMVGKRIVDLVASTIGLMVMAPLGLVVAALILLDSPGPVFYRQVRVGLNGRPYTIWKFRSMKWNAEHEGPQWATVGDVRVTRVGRWLRKWRLDEFPQLINVIKGEMSLIGPRPERPPFVQELREEIPYYDVRHTLRPGITGWAQIKYQYAASTDQAHAKLQYDLYYVKNLSLLLDARILMETVRVVLFGDGAR